MSDSARYRNNRARWTLADLNFLENNYGTLPVAEIATRLGRTLGAIGLMADKLGCRKKRNAPWNEAEIAIIRSHYAQGIEAGSLTSLLPGRSVNAIFSMAETLGIKSGRFWQQGEIDILNADYPRWGTAIAERLPGRSEVAIVMMARRLGLKKSRNSKTGFRPWSDEEWMLLENNMHLSVSQQSTLFPDRTPRAVEKARGRLIKNRAKTSDHQRRQTTGESFHGEHSLSG